MTKRERAYIIKMIVVSAASRFDIFAFEEALSKKIINEAEAIDILEGIVLYCEKIAKSIPSKYALDMFSISTNEIIEKVLQTKLHKSL